MTGDDAQLREQKQRDFAIAQGLALGDTQDPTHFRPLRLSEFDHGAPLAARDCFWAGMALPAWISGRARQFASLFCAELSWSLFRQGGPANIRVRMYRVGFGDFFLLTVPERTALPIYSSIAACTQPTSAVSTNA